MSDVHIASFVLQGRQDIWPSLCDAVRAMPGVELSHELQMPGKAVVVIEGEPSHITRCIDALHALPGFLNLVFVYQQAGSAAALDEEIVP